jgi:Pol polyprotein
MVEEAAVDLAPLIIAEPDPLLGTPDDSEVMLHWEGEEIMLEEELTGAAIMQVNETLDNWICVELYDSGATCYISPYKSDFISYAPLSSPVFLNMANQQQFPAIGCGTLAIQVPNGDREIKLTLHGALHTPGVSYTLVSLATLDEEGYHAHIGAGHLDLTSPQGKKLDISLRPVDTCTRLYMLWTLPMLSNLCQSWSYINTSATLQLQVPESLLKVVPL